LRGAKLASSYGIDEMVGKDLREACLKSLKAISPLTRAKH